MAESLTANSTLDHVLRAAQLFFAVIVMGTDGYGMRSVSSLLINSIPNSFHLAIHTFRTYVVPAPPEYGSGYETVNVPNAWGFLMFCAGWTFVAVIFHYLAGKRVMENAVFAYTGVAVEAVAVLSWLAGFIAVAVSAGSDVCPAGGSAACPAGNNCRGTLTAASVFGAFEWLLFVVTVGMTYNLVFRMKRPS